jgi:hypothetical protein
LANTPVRKSKSPNRNERECTIFVIVRRKKARKYYKNMNVHMAKERIGPGQEDEEKNSRSGAPEYLANGVFSHCTFL